MGKRVTVRQVAALAGVSPRTVSNVVNNYPYVAESTRTRVQMAIDSLGYRPNAAARSLRSGRTGLLGVVLPALDQPYFAELARALIQHASAAGFTVVLEQTDGHRERELELISDRAKRSLFDGLIVSPLSIVSEEINLEEARPLVLLGERALPLAVDHVHINNVKASHAAVQHLVDCGRRTVALIGIQHVPTGQSAKQRQLGAMRALAEAGLQAFPDLMVPTQEYTRYQGYQAMQNLLSSGQRFDSVFCFNDTLAIGALRALRENGVSVPDDVAIVGFDDIEETQFSAPPLTTICPDKPEIARIAVGRIVEQLVDGSLSAEEIEVPFSLTRRASTIG